MPYLHRAMTPSGSSTRLIADDTRDESGLMFSGSPGGYSLTHKRLCARRPGRGNQGLERSRAAEHGFG